jgi:hypothetical protein
MVLEKTYPAGAEEWCCPTCGRRFLLQWPPNYKKIILEAGDEAALHSGGKGGISMHPPEVMATEALAAEEEKLAPWLAWLEEVDFDGLWNGEVE